jgi:hypothetical protein
MFVGVLTIDLYAPIRTVAFVCRRRFVVLQSACYLLPSQKFAHLCNIRYCSEFENVAFTGSGVAPTSEVRTTHMLVLLMAGY